MAQFVGEDGHVTTIDRFDVMIKSEENLPTPGLRRKGHFLEGQAAEILPNVGRTFYDFILWIVPNQNTLNFT